MDMVENSVYNEIKRKVKVTEQQMNIIKCHLKKVPANDFQKDILLASIWVREK